MSDLEQYFALVRKHPEMFETPPGGEITILLDEGEIRGVEDLMRQRYMARGQPVAWADVGVVYQDQYMLLLRDAVRFSDGSLGTYFRTVNDDGIPGTIIIPVYQRQVVLTRHFRHATRKWHLEIPRGFGTKGLSNEENALKELEEEIGAIITCLVSLGRAYPNTGASSEYNEFFYAEIASYGKVDAHEGICELLLVNVEELETLIRNNTIDDEFTIVAYTRAKLQGLL